MNSVAPKLSIVIPVRNDVRIRLALESIRTQSVFEDVELIVVDGDSDDDTKQIIELYSESISTLIAEPDAGIYDAMNKGIEAATGEIVGILNADDRYVNDNVLEQVINAFEDSTLDGFYSNMAFTNIRKYVHRVWKSGPGSMLKWRLGWMPPHPTLFLRKHVYEDFGLFDTSFSITADYELMLRLLVKNKIRVRHLAKYLVIIAPGGASTRNIRTIVSANSEIYRAWQKNELRGGWIAPITKPARKLFQLRLGTSPHNV